MTLKELLIFGACGVMVTAQNNTITSNSTLTSNSTEIDYETSISFEQMIATESVNYTAKYDFLKEHSCNCPAIFGDFAIGGVFNGTADELDIACHKFRRCMTCVSADTSCADKVVNELSFNWQQDEGQDAVCRVNEDGCAAKKCECHIQFLNDINKAIIEWQRKNQTATGARNAPVTPNKVELGECEHAAGNRDKCCLVGDNSGKKTWALYDKKEGTCMTKGNETTIVKFTKFSDGCFNLTDVDTSRDYSIQFTLNTSDKPNSQLDSDYRIIFRVGTNKYQMYPKLYYKDKSRDFSLQYSCSNRGFTNKTMTDYSLGLKENMQMTIKVDVLKSQNKMIMYKNGVADANEAPIHPSPCFVGYPTVPVQAGGCWSADEPSRPISVDSFFDYNFEYLN